MPKDALSRNVQDDRRLVRKLHLSRGRNSAQQLKRILGDGGGVSKAVLDAVRDAVCPREVRPAFYQAPNIPIPGAPVASAFNKRVRVDQPFLGDVIALRATRLSPGKSPLVRAIPKNAQEVWAASAASRIARFGKPRGKRMGGGGENINAAWTGFRWARDRDRQFQGNGARPRTLERRDGVYRGI